MILVNKENNVLIAIVTTAKKVENGIYVDKGLLDENGNKKDCIYADINNSIEIYDVEVPKEVAPITHCYTVELGFYKNPDYVPPQPSPVVELEQLKQKTQELELALVEMTTLAAKQVQRNIQNDQAIMELTQMFVGGNA